MKKLSLKVDPKGRIQIPKGVRQRLGIKSEVSLSVENEGVRIEPIEGLYDRLSSEIEFNFGSVERDMPKLRKAAEKELLRLAS